MNKADTASYLVSLHTLIEAQSKGAYSLASKWLGEEYTKHWGILRDTITKEHEDDARKSSDDNREPKDGTDQPRRERMRSESDR